jgi:hypothetical protein
MTEEYFNPTKSIVAEMMKRKMAESVIGGRTTHHKLVDTSNGNSKDLLALVSKMTAEEREQLKKLLDEQTPMCA